MSAITAQSPAKSTRARKGTAAPEALTALPEALTAAPVAEALTYAPVAEALTYAPVAEALTDAPVAEALTDAPVAETLTAPTHLPAVYGAHWRDVLAHHARTLTQESRKGATPSGKAKVAHSAAAIARMGKAGHASADTITLCQLASGQFGPFLNDTWGSLSLQHRNALTEAVRLATAYDHNGKTLMVSDHDAMTSRDKATARAVAAWFAAPTATVRGVPTAKDLPKGLQYLAGIATAWTALEVGITDGVTTLPAWFAPIPQ